MIQRVSYFLLLIAAFSACNLIPGLKPKKEGKSVARVFDSYLYESDLAGLVPAGTSAKDSLEITGNYINNWIRQELLLHQAEANLSDEQMNVEKQVELYRNSLVIFQYESELVKQKLDTNISMQEIEEYYTKNQANFQLHENILRASFISVSKNSPMAPKFRQLLRSEKPADRDKLVELCQQYAAGFQLNDADWISFADFATKVPVQVSDQLEFLAKNPYFEVQDSSFQYFVRVKEYKIKESVSPLSFEVPNIRAILLNKRKSEMLSKMEDDLYQAALRKKNFEIYKKK